MKISAKVMKKLRDYADKKEKEFEKELRENGLEFLSLSSLVAYDPKDTSFAFIEFAIELNKRGGI